MSAEKKILIYGIVYNVLSKSKCVITIKLDALTEISKFTPRIVIISKLDDNISNMVEAFENSRSEFFCWKCLRDAIVLNKTDFSITRTYSVHSSKVELKKAWINFKVLFSKV